MQRLLVLGLLLFAGVAGSWMGTAARSAGDDPKGEKKEEKKKAGGRVLNDCNNKVCAVALLLNLGAYCHFYAIRCPNLPVALAADCSTSYPRFCGGQCEGCIPVGMQFHLKKEKALWTQLDENQLAEQKYVDEGIPAGTLSPNPATVLPAGSLTTYAVDPFYAKLELPPLDGQVPTVVKVKFYTVKHVTEAGLGPTYIFGAGLHVGDSISPTTPTIPHHNIVRTTGHAVIVLLGNVNYQVILWKGTEFKPLESAAKAP